MDKLALLKGVFVNQKFELLEAITGFLKKPQKYIN